MTDAQTAEFLRILEDLANSSAAVARNVQTLLDRENSREEREKVRDQKIDEMARNHAAYDAQVRNILVPKVESVSEALEKHVKTAGLHSRLSRV